MEGANRLIGERSPYLQQHAHNPVDWYPWGDEAFAKAGEFDRPIFLSIGYSTCHWCHVMERESFEDEEVAAALNRSFVNIKVDREERPDIDSVYMKVCQMMIGQGGWPLTIIMTPDKVPFFAATYLPKRARMGQPGILDVIDNVSRVWAERRGEVLKVTEQIKEALDQSSATQWDVPEDAAMMAFEDLVGAYDDRHGGFGNAPKFPTPTRLMFLLRHWRRTGSRKALDMVTSTIRAMRLGGIFDQVGKGFHRYSTDERWKIPHFEKMLYDQALMLIACAESFQASGDTFFANVAREVVEYMEGRLLSPRGGFYSAEDADSEGEEGMFYLWTKEEFDAVLGETATKGRDILNVTARGNYLDPFDPHPGRNVLHLTADPFSDPVMEELRDILPMLNEARETRVRPMRDEKVLTDWNGLAIAALAKASRAVDREYLTLARGCADLVLGEMWADGTLYHSWIDGERKVPGFLEDHAFFVWGLVELYQASFEVRYLRAARDIADRMIELFSDGRGMFHTSELNETLLVREKNGYDGAIPSGNSVAMLSLLQLYGLVGDERYLEKATAIPSAFAGGLVRSPEGHSMLLCAIDMLPRPIEVAIFGDGREADGMVYALDQKFVPEMTLIRYRPGLEEVSMKAGDRTAIDGGTAYVCIGSACLPPAFSAEELLERISEN